MGFLKNLFKKDKHSAIDDEVINQSFTEFNNLMNMDLKDIFTLEDENKFVTAMSNYLGKKSDYGDNLEVLSECERIFYTTDIFEGEINNGGFEQYIYNSSGQTANEIITALNIIGAKQITEIYQKVFDIFSCEIPTEQEKREEWFDKKLDDTLGELIEQCDSDYYNLSLDTDKLKYNYAMKNKEYFS